MIAPSLILGKERGGARHARGNRHRRGKPEDREGRTMCPPAHRSDAAKGRKKQQRPKRKTSIFVRLLKSRV